MKNNKKEQQITQIKHWLGIGIYGGGRLMVKRWYFVLVAILVGYVLIIKDLSLTFNATNPTQQTITTTDNEILIPEKMVNIFELTNYLTYEALQYTDNRGNTFSNIGFVLNPGYAKRKGIDPRIVAQKQRIVDNYVKLFAPVAVNEMKRYRIPASITLAQGLLESDAGRSKLARLNNNHFGVKCFLRTCRAGHCTNYTDDSHKDFFRNYKSAWTSYRDHSIFLQKPRYKHLTKLKPTDYKNWAHGLRKAGYATDKKYAHKLIQLIEALKLYQYDKT